MTRKIILETDMESDIDDAGTLGMLHALADNGECEILAVMHNTSDEFGPGVISAINAYYGRPDLPIGSYKPDDAPSSQFAASTLYAEDLATNPAYPKQVVRRSDVPDALELYKRLLANCSDNSVVISSVGWTMNLSRLLQDPLGATLIRDKVALLAVMGGRWDPVDTPNPAWMNLAGNQEVQAASAAASHVVARWPTPMLFSGMEIGRVVNTGECLKATPGANPVREVYRLYKTKAKVESWDHPSWDQCTTLDAVRTDAQFSHDDRGKARMFLIPEGNGGKAIWHTAWDTSETGGHIRQIVPADPIRVTQIISGLMSQPPR